ncbi:MAG: cytochrome P450 [Patulibacter sp.]
MTSQTLPGTELDGPQVPEPTAAVTLNRRQMMRLFAQASRRDFTDIMDGFPAGSGLVKLAVPGAPVVFVRHPAHAREILVTDQDLWQKGVDYKILALLLGQGLLTNEDPDGWQRNRRLVQPLFARRHLQPMAEHITGAAADWLDELGARTQPGDTLDASREMMGLTLQVVGRALFGAQIPAPTVRTVGEALTEVLDAAGSYLDAMAVMRSLSRLPRVTFDDVLRWRRGVWRQAQRGKASLDRVVYELIEQRAAASAEAGAEDLLSLLLTARDERGDTALDTEQVRDEVMTFLAAGHETTANAMTWLFLLLSRNPAARQRLEAEVDEVLGGRTPTLADADALPWTNACFQEAMRIFPPVPAISRVAIRRRELGGELLPAGTVAVVAPFLIHRDPLLWPNPEGFDPERFMPGPDGRPPARHKQAFMPFGAGRRVCVGQGFALLEGVLLTAMFAQRYRLDLAPGARIGRDSAITMRPKHGMPMTLHAR